MVWLGLVTEPQAIRATVSGFRRVKRLARAWSTLKL
jgi:hypothetical protein